LAIAIGRAFWPNGNEISQKMTYASEPKGCEEKSWQFQRRIAPFRFQYQLHQVLMLTHVNPYFDGKTHGTPIWLVVLTILKNMSSSMGRIIPYIMENEKCIKMF
jgi:hypothetical protein